MYMFLPHMGVLSGEAVKKIQSSKIKKLVITDSIDNSKKLKIIVKLKFYPYLTLWQKQLKEYPIRHLCQICLINTCFIYKS